MVFLCECECVCGGCEVSVVWSAPVWSAAACAKRQRRRRQQLKQQQQQQQRQQRQSTRGSERVSEKHKPWRDGRLVKITRQEASRQQASKGHAACGMWQGGEWGMRQPKPACNAKMNRRLALTMANSAHDYYYLFIKI